MKKVILSLVGMAISAVMMFSATYAWQNTNGRFGGASIGVKTDEFFMISPDGQEFGFEADGNVSGELTPCSSGQGDVLTQVFYAKSDETYTKLRVKNIEVDNQVEFTKCLRVEITYGDVTLCYSPCRDQSYDWTIDGVIDSTPREVTIRYWWEQMDEACTEENALSQGTSNVFIELEVTK